MSADERRFARATKLTLRTVERHVSGKREPTKRDTIRAPNRYHGPERSTAHVYSPAPKIVAAVSGAKAAKRM